MTLFARLLQFTPGDDARAAVRDKHRAHLRELLGSGHLVMSGPWIDDNGALIVYDVDTIEDAHALIAADPYTQAGVVTEAGLHAWNVVFDRSAVAEVSSPR